MRRRFAWHTGLAPLLLLTASGCADTPSQELSHPSVEPATQPTASLKVDASRISAMYDHRLLAVDLPTVVHVAMARNIDIKEAQQRVEASRGGYESSVGAIFPSLTPNVTPGHPGGNLKSQWLGAGDLLAFLSGGRDRVDHQSRAGSVQRHRVETTA